MPAAAQPPVRADPVDEPVAAASAQEAAPATPDGEIIGGHRADPGEYPFQVALLQHTRTGDAVDNLRVD